MSTCDARIAQAKIVRKGSFKQTLKTKIAHSEYEKSGITIGKIDKPIQWSDLSNNGLRLGIHIPDGAALSIEVRSK